MGRHYIIYLEPSGISYGSLVCVRPLTIIGNGYCRPQNPGLQLDVREAIMEAITFASGSAGSRITGCTIANTLSIGASTITVERNRFSTAYTYIGCNPAIGSVGGQWHHFSPEYRGGWLGRLYLSRLDGRYGG